MRARSLVGGGVGLVALVGAYAYTYYPDRVLSVPQLAQLPDALSDLDPALVLAGFGALSILYAALAAWSPFRVTRDPPPESPAERFAERQENPPEFVHGDDRTRVASGFDDAVSDAVAGSGGDLAHVRRDLRETATAVLTYEADPEDAAAAVASGSWTDDRVASAFLAEEDGPSYPLLERLREWVDADAARERRIARTVDAIEAWRAANE